MPVNLRLSLSIFKIGFAAESAGGFVALLSGSSKLPFDGLLVLLNPAFTAVGILFLWIGRHEWNEIHRARVGYTNLAFAASIVAIALAAAPIGILALYGNPSPPSFVGVEFGAAIALVFAITFVTYALVAAHLVGRLGEIAMGLGLGWAVLLSALIGIALAPNLQPIVQSVSARSPALGGIFQPITLLDALLAFSYLAFFVAFVDAHYRVAKGLTPEGGVATLSTASPPPA
ncbi:MAG: hypothetical protein ABSA63_04920 [Thermoplasmata archaeon]|jgi:Na+/phosphate symporter